MNTEERRASRSRSLRTPEVTPTQRAFWQAITVGELETMQVLLQHKDVDINMYDESGDQRIGCTALHLAILEMPTWKTEGRTEGRNGIQTAEYVKKFFSTLLEHGADIDKACKYNSEWYLQTAAGKTKSFYPDGYNSIGLVLQFVEITRGAEVISTNVTRRLELIRDLLLEHIKADEDPAPSLKYCTLSEDLGKAFESGKFSDVQLICKNEVISAHRVVLAARSSVFAAMLDPDSFLESVKRTVDIKETEPGALRTFIRFLYDDNLAEHPVTTDFELCENLIKLANRYDVDALRSKCSDIILKHHLKVDRAAQILCLAHENQAHDLKEQTLTFISDRRYMEDVMETEDFKQMDSELVQDLLRTVVNARGSPNSRRKKTRASSGSGSIPSSSKRLRGGDSASEEDPVRAPPNQAADDASEEGAA